MIRIYFIRKLVKKILSDSKISSPPVSEEIVAKSLGLQIIYYPFPEEISAVLIKDKDLLAIGVNQNHHPNRQRFSIAHEIGHYKLGHGDDLFIEFSDLDFITKRSGSLNLNFEQEANQFASELLIPIDMVKTDCKNEKDIKLLSKRYKVSEQAMLLRLLNLKLL
jgi:Zn-dependent peptidase ImmA (M78 family)